MFSSMGWPVVCVASMLKDYSGILRVIACTEKRDQQIISFNLLLFPLRYKNRTPICHKLDLKFGGSLGLSIQLEKQSFLFLHRSYHHIFIYSRANDKTKELFFVKIRSRPLYRC